MDAMTIAQSHILDYTCGCLFELKEKNMKSMYRENQQNLEKFRILDQSLWKEERLVSF